MNKVGRREFIRTSVAAVTLSPVILGCERNEFDLIIRAGSVYDGLAHEPVSADVGIRGDRIIAIANLSGRTAHRTIDAASLAVSPGFIDVHTHSDMAILANPKCESKIRQGVTTEICGNCGDSPFPLEEEKSLQTITALRNEYKVAVNWRTLAGYWQRLEKSKSALNVANLVGHGSLREAVMGGDNREPTVAELQRMKSILQEYMVLGSLGMSSGLEYQPGMFAATSELIELAQVVAKHGGVYATHMRNEDLRVQEALAEALAIAAAAGCRAQISHLKACQKRNWYKTPLLLEAIEKARQNGLEVYADRYPYTAYSTSMKLLFPSWSRESGSQDFVRRLKSAEQWKKIRPFLEDKISALGSWESVLITRLSSKERANYQGKTISQLAAQADAFEFVRELLIAEQGEVHMCGFGMSEEDTAAVLAFPYTMVGSDGNVAAPYGVLGNGTPHPRFYGTFPRYLGLYVRQKKILSLAEAIRRITSLPCRHFSLQDRGALVENKLADLVVFNPQTIIDCATYTEPHQYPLGISYVIVNGQVVIEKGKHTGKLPGRVLRRA